MARVCVVQFCLNVCKLCHRSYHEKSLSVLYGEVLCCADILAGTTHVMSDLLGL